MRAIAAIFSFVLLSAIPAGSQVITGTILGTVTDESGAAVAGAKVVIRNSGTNVRTDLATNQGGEFAMPYLQPGVYDVTVEAAGFKSFRESGIRLAIDSKYRVEAKMALGTVSESVTVVASAQALQTDASDLSHTVSETAIQSLPNIGRSAIHYVMTTAGVVPGTGFEDPDNIGIGDDSRTNFSRFTVNGSRQISSEILLDGAPNTSGAFNEVAVLPNLDAIGQFKVVTNAFSAEYGRAGGGVVSFGTKSGANQLHGSLYEYFRNPALNANTFGNNLFGRYADGTPVRPKGKFNTNQFGGSFSGPVALPKLYSGRDKTFFFVSYEGVRRAQDASAFITVPTAIERVGDFSKTVAQVRAPNGSLVLVPRQVYLPLPSTSTVTELSNGQFRVNRQQAVDGAIANKIPSRFLNPTALKLLSYHPLPNITPINADGTSNYFDSTSNYTRTDQIIVKLDQNFGQKHKTFFRWTTDWTGNVPRNRYRDTYPSATDQAPTSQFNPTATLGHTWALSTRSLVDFRANVTRINLVLQPSSGLNEDLAGLGFSKDMLAPLPSFAFPRISSLPYPQMGLGNFVLRDNHTTNFSFTGSYTKILDKWTLKMGGEYRPLMNNFYQAYVPSMAFVPINMTAACAGTGCPSLAYDQSQGYTPADFLLGSMDGQISGGQYSTGDPALALKNTYLAVFMQNDWKASRKLTVNIGLRWDYQGPLTERFDRMSQFDLNSKNPTGTRGIYVFSGHNGVDRGQTATDFRNWGPRIGFAYRATNRMVIRSAYGISYDQITGVGSGAQGFGTDGFSYPSYVRVRPLSGLNIVERPFNDAFNGGGTILGTDPKNPAYLGRTVTALLREQRRIPYVQQWNFTIERELKRGLHMTLAYVGTKGTRITIQQYPHNGNNSIAQPVIDDARAAYARTGVNPLTQRVANPFYGLISGNATLSGPTIDLLSLNKAFPAYAAVNVFQGRFGSSSYNSLQVSLRKALSRGVEISGNYTWSKNIDFGNSIGAVQGGGGTSSFTVNNFALERSVSANDIPHRAVVNYVVELPFGRGKRLLAGTPVVKQVVSGWKVAGITTFSAGFPMLITGGAFGRPDRVGDPVLPKEYRVIGDGVTAHPLPDGTSVVVPIRRMLYFNPKAYRNRVLNVPTTSGTSTQWVDDIYWYGNSPRFNSGLRGYGVNNWNMTVSRTFRVTEKVRTEVRCEALNATNRVEFSMPDRAFGSTNLGRSGQAANAIGQSTSANFGTIDVTTQQRSPRYLQLSLRVTW